MSIKPSATIYTDGSCLGNPGPGGWAAIVISDGKEQEMSGGERNTTNNRMELTAVINGLKALRGPHIVTIHSDSQYVTNAYNQNWIRSWKANGWMRKAGELLNADLWKELDRLVEKHSCSFVWVKGHAGNVFNERADVLAVAESKKQCNESERRPSENTQQPDESTQDDDLGFLDIDCGLIFECERATHALTCLDKVLRDFFSSHEAQEAAAVVCLESALKHYNMGQYEIATPCGASPWCEHCGGASENECAHAYMAYIRK